jgi:hypothetical protein
MFQVDWFVEPPLQVGHDEAHVPRPWPPRAPRRKRRSDASRPVHMALLSVAIISTWKGVNVYAGQRSERGDAGDGRSRSVGFERGVDSWPAARCEARPLENE